MIEHAIPYRDPSGLDDYARAQCMVDLYVPDGARDFLTVVWLHGGGLEQGEREIPPALMDQGIAVVGVGYRLRPHVGTPAYIEDAAAAVAYLVGQ